jgi:flagellin-like hook-associated protein FlgL
MKRDLNFLKRGMEESNKTLSTMKDLLVQISSSATRSSSSELSLQVQQQQHVKRP